MTLRVKWSTLKKLVEEEGVKVALSGQDVPCRSNWICGVNSIATLLR